MAKVVSSAVVIISPESAQMVAGPVPGRAKVSAANAVVKVKAAKSEEQEAAKVLEGLSILRS